MRCNNCDRELQEGETAWEIPVKKIVSKGNKVSILNGTVIQCKDCYAQQ